MRDTLTQPDDDPATGLMREALTLDSGTTVYTALAAMRQTRNHLAVVHDGNQIVGVVTLADVLRRLFPEVRPAAG